MAPLGHYTLLLRCWTLSQWQKTLIISEKQRNLGKATELMQKDFELPFLSETSSESELLSYNNLLTWFVFWMCFEIFLPKK